MSYASLNFSLDLILICVALAFLIRDYPARTGVLTLLCILSYVVPLTWIQDAIDPQLVHAPSPHAAPAQKAPTPETAVEHAQTLSRANPSEVQSSVMGLWSTVLNGLSAMPGASSSSDQPFNTERAVADRMEQTGVVADINKETAGMSPLEKKFFSQRLGHTLNVREVSLVEQFWFLARCCLLAGAAYFVLVDWKITMSIVSLCVIPIHYYMVLLIFLGLNWRKTEPWWGPIGGILLGLVAFVFFANVLRQRLTHKESHTFEIPDPAQFRARLNGHEFDFEVVGDHLKVADIALDLNRSYLDPENHSLLRFQGGAMVEFIPRA